MQDLSKLLEYAVEQRDKALSNNTLYTVTYWNGYIDAINKIMEAKMCAQTEVKDYPPYLDRPKMKGGAE